MRELSRVIDERPRGAVPRAALWVRQRRLFLGAALALAEVLYLIISRPGTLLMSALAFVVLVAGGMGISRVRPGLVRDLLIVVVIAQALVLVMPLAIGFGVAVGLLTALALLALLAVAAFRLRV